MRWRAALAVGLTGVALSACGTPQSPAAAVSAWATSNDFGVATANLLGDSHRIVVAITAHRPAITIGTLCEEALGNAMGEYSDLLPTPDIQLTDLFADAADAFIHLDGQCADHPGSARVLAEVVRERFIAVGRLEEAVLREEAVSDTTVDVKGPTG